MLCQRVKIEGLAIYDDAAENCRTFFLLLIQNKLNIEIQSSYYYCSDQSCTIISIAPSFRGILGNGEKPLEPIYPQ